MRFSEQFRKQVIRKKGNKCTVEGCGRDPSEESGERETISVHPINGDPDDERLENAIPVCQSCVYHIYRVDEPPYQYWHRQLPVEERVIEQHNQDPYEGEQLSSKEAFEFKSQGKKPHSVKYDEESN